MCGDDDAYVVDVDDVCVLCVVAMMLIARVMCALYCMCGGDVCDDDENYNMCVNIMMILICICVFVPVTMAKMINMVLCVWCVWFVNCVCVVYVMYVACKCCAFCVCDV